MFPLVAILMLTALPPVNLTQAAVMDGAQRLLFIDPELWNVEERGDVPLVTFQSVLHFFWGKPY